MVKAFLLTSALAASIAAVPTALSTLRKRQLGSTTAELDGCPGYSVSNVQQDGNTVTADLNLAGDACNAYGTDIESLALTVTYETDKRLHVTIEDADKQVYRVPSKIFPRPGASEGDHTGGDLEFSWNDSPFNFQVKRRSSGAVLFDSSAAQLVFEDQYVRLRTSLPDNPNIYGLGEHSDQFRLNSTDNVRTLWSRDSFGIPEGTNLYGNHPIYFDHRGADGTHGVFLLSSAGMDIKLNQSDDGSQYLEYNALGGVIDLYFLAGDNPTEVSREYANLAGKPALNSYWSLGFHSCRYGYRDFYGVAETITNYSSAGIPLEVQWTDIDYMYERWVFTTDPDRYPVPRVRDIVNYLHEHNQHYIVMVDPAVAYEDYLTFNRGVEDDIFLKYENGSLFVGVVWPGPTAFPDWFHPNAQNYWIREFREFFNAEEGIDIDGLWIDMNEAANFCQYPCEDPEGYSSENRFPPGRPPVRSQPRPIPGFPPEFQPGASDAPPDSTPYNDPNLAPPATPGDKKKRDLVVKRQVEEIPDFSAPLDTPIGLPDRNFLAPPYRIDNQNTYADLGGLSNSTVNTDIQHYHGLRDLDIHNLYGTMMSEISRGAMLDRRPGLRPLVITRSTFAGAGRYVAKWLGDNLSTWDQYRRQIQGMLDFSAHFQIPMVGSDVCGFGGNTTETLCARWAMLGAFNPFYRNHNQDSALPQEFYIWDSVAEAARKAIDIRYRLLDYFYTAMYEQHLDGTPSLHPLYHVYPADANTFGNALQFFYGPSLLVSPVTEENATSVSIYLPDDLFYDFYTYEPVRGSGAPLNLTDVPFDHIPLHYRAGRVVPQRAKSGMTTSDVRKEAFHVVVAPAEDGTATGTLYLDDGVSIVQPGPVTYITMKYRDCKLAIKGKFGYKDRVRISKVTVLGGEKKGHGRVKRGAAGELESRSESVVEAREVMDGRAVELDLGGLELVEDIEIELRE